MKKFLKAKFLNYTVQKFKLQDILKDLTEAFQKDMLAKIIEQINNIEYDIVSTSMETWSSGTEQEVTSPIEDI